MPRRWRLRLRLGLVAPVEPGRLAPTATSVPWSIAGRFQGTREVDMVPGGASAWRREVFDAHRYSRFFDGYAQGEDLEMSLRIGRSWRLLWCGDARVLHAHAGGGRPQPRRKGQMEVRNRFFIWKRHLPSVPVAERIRFWMDIGFVAACDIGEFLLGRGTATLRHAVGVLEGAWSCWIDPPRCEEPQARPEYRVEWRRLGDDSAEAARIRT
jgi:hypothetical protein